MRLILTCWCFFAFVLSARTEERPNIVLILADDLGWSDLGCYGSELFETPHLDGFATEGMRFTQAYSPAPICSASRASILTGKSPARLHFEFVTKKNPGYQPNNTPLRAPAFTLDLSTEESTLAETLTGYQTAFFGKWHVSRHYNGYLGWSPTHGPKSQGFDVAEEDFGSHPYSYWDQKGKRTFTMPASNEIAPDSLTDRAIAYLERSHSEPFFQMVSHFYVHTPVHTRNEMLHAHYLEKIPADHPRRDALAHYGAMVTTLDHHVGQLLDAIDPENTLVIFTSDNGGHPEYGGNAPLRGSKWNLYEGGIRVPFIARWPEKIAAGSVETRPVIGTDLHATFREVAGLDPDPETDSHSILPTLLGKSDRSANHDFIWHFPYHHPETGYQKAPEKIGVDDGYTSKTFPQSAIRSGDWKLIRYYAKDRTPELYHLPDDPDESENLANAEPAILARLSQALDDRLDEADARFPEPNPDYIEP